MLLVKRLRRPSAREKPILIALAASLAALIVAGASFVAHDVAEARGELKDHLLAVAEGIAINTTPALEFESLDAARDPLAALRADRRIETAVLYDLKGNSVDYRRGDLGAVTVPPLPGEDGAHFEDGKLKVHKRVVREGRILGTVFLETDAGVLRRRLAGYARLGAIAGAFSLLAAFLVATALEKRLADR